MATQDDLFFRGALRRKQAIQQQQADTASQDVAQKSSLQQQGDDAALRRAQIAADTSLQNQSMQNQGAANVAGINAQSRQDVANIGEAGANARTGLTTRTQRDIAGMENQLGRDRLNQQGQQFNQTLGLDTAKAKESSIQGRAALQSPEYGAPSFNPRTGAMESAIKRPAIAGLAPSPLSTLGGGSGLSMESDEDLRRRRALAAASAQ